MRSAIESPGPLPVDPETGVVQSAAVAAGLSYRVIATKLSSGQITVWLAWETGVTRTGDEVSYALHLAEITSPSTWDGGPAPYGTQALKAAHQCVT
ncbi:hypothetical protein [Propionicimonas sp.]|uniref:hypothetical protein n=1 Tax=Propionicimonas sp. TaxID=1955623 RepID=UPI0039E531EA